MLIIFFRVILTAYMANLFGYIPDCCGFVVNGNYHPSLIQYASTKHFEDDGKAIDKIPVSHSLSLNHSVHSGLPTPQASNHCPFGEHRCYDGGFRTSQIRVTSCTGNFVHDSDYTESKPNSDGLWELSGNLYDSSHSWWSTRSDGIPLIKSRCNQIGLFNPSYSPSFDWLSLYAWYIPAPCFSGRRGASAVRMECMDDVGKITPVLFFWHFMPVVLATSAPTGATSLATISRLGVEFDCQWSWTIVLINTDCGPYHPIVKSADCFHTYCVRKP